MGYLTVYIYEMNEQFYYEIYNHSKGQEEGGEFVGRKGFGNKKKCAKNSYQKIIKYLFELPEETKKPKKLKTNRYPRAMRICQNCIYCNNEKGKWFKDGWNILCNNKGRFFTWNKRKRCFKRVATASDLDLNNISIEITKEIEKKNE
jgi:hypothetical protein